MAVPGTVIQSRKRRCGNFLRVSSHDGVGSHLNCDWTLGIFAQSHTGNSQHGRLFLNSTRISEHQTGATVEALEIQVTKRLDYTKTFVR